MTSILPTRKPLPAFSIYVKNLAGLKIGIMTVIEIQPKRPQEDYRRWKCQCDCGNIRYVPASHLVRALKLGKMKSCGCLHPNGSTRHGLTKDPVYQAWVGMLRRCNNPKHPSYKNYGGRGIKVCERWHDLDNFMKDMSPKPSPELTLDRIDNDKGYSPDNCRWASRVEQGFNMRSTRVFIIDGERKTFKDLSEETGLSIRLLKRRCYGGWTLEEMLKAKNYKRRSSP